MRTKTRLDQIKAQRANGLSNGIAKHKATCAAPNVTNPNPNLGCPYFGTGLPEHN